MDFKARWRFFRSLRFPRWEPIAVGFPIVFTVFTFWRDEAPAELQPPLIIPLIEQIPWEISALITVSLLFAFVFEASYRKVGEVRREAAQAIRAYYKIHYGSSEWRGVGSGCQCDACRKARTFASLIGVDLDKEDET